MVPSVAVANNDLETVFLCMYFLYVAFYEPTPHNALTSGGYEDICDTESHIEGQVCK